MRIEIDQSGKIEDTSRPTVVGFSNNRKKTVIISAIEKQRLQRYFRKFGKPRQFIYYTFAALIFSLLRNLKSVDEIVIDREYPGQEGLIKGYLLGLLRRSGRSDVHKKMVGFRSIGKKAGVHQLVYMCYRAKKADRAMKAKEVLKILNI